MVSADQAAADWVAGLAAKTTKIKTGAESVRVAPGQAAARQDAAYLAGVQANVGKWKTNVGKVTLQDWLTAFVDKGIPRIASGATAAQPKFAAFMQQLLPHIERSVASLPARGTYEQNKARANAMMDAMHSFRRT